MVDDVVVKAVQTGLVRFASAAVVRTKSASKILIFCVELGAVRWANILMLTVGWHRLQKNTSRISKRALRTIPRAISSKYLTKRIFPHTDIIRSSINSIVVVCDSFHNFFSRTGEEALSLIEYPRCCTTSAYLMSAFDTVWRTFSEGTVCPFIIILDGCWAGEIEQSVIALTIQTKSWADASQTASLAGEAFIFDHTIDVNLTRIESWRA